MVLAFGYFASRLAPKMCKALAEAAEVFPTAGFLTARAFSGNPKIPEPLATSAQETCAEQFCRSCVLVTDHVSMNG
jgi:hypothetical protein